MKARAFLEQVKKIDKMIENKLAEVEKWKQIAQGLGGSGADADKVKSSGKPDKMAEAVAKYVDLENEINEHIDQLIEVKKDVLTVIEMLNVIEYDFLYKHYFDFEDVGEIAYKMGRSYSWATTTHARALASVQKILDERTGFVARYEKVVGG
ncbi:MAG: hypothetical protein IKU66_05320 [Clostridia bacterium]|nr:hypothetical protein [Clostridia bacterium]